MHKTLFTPAMIETFGACKRAYEVAFHKYTNETASSGSASVICKKFILRALAEINRGKLHTVNQVQKFTGQHWPVTKLEEQGIQKDKLTQAFLFVYKSLIKYVGKPYRPDGAQVVSVALKVRARVAHIRVYVEDTFDLVLYYPQEKRLEVVDFQLHPLKPVDPAWPSAALQVKYFLAEKLKTRWPFEKLTLTQYRVGLQDFAPLSINLEESIFRVHWSELVTTIEAMKNESADNVSCTASEKGTCAHCRALDAQVRESTTEVAAAERLIAC